MIPKRTHTIQVKHYSDGADEDRHGNKVAGYGDPIDVEVYAVHPRGWNTADIVPGRTEVVEGLTVLGPGTITIGPHDRVVWNGAEYEVDGDVADWTTGPFVYQPGVSVNLKRVEG